MAYQTFIDLDFNFTAHPETGDIVKVTDDKAIKESVKHLVLTHFYTRPFHPEVGCYTTSLLFEPNISTTEKSIERTVKDVIFNHEKRVVVQYVDAGWNESEAGYDITIVFEVVGLLKELSVDLFLQRLR